MASSRLYFGIPWKPDSRSISRCPLTTAHAIWRNRLEPPGYEPGGTHPRAHERVYGPQNTSMASFERLIAAPCSTGMSNGVHVQTSDHLDRHPELSRPSDHIWGELAERATALYRPHSRSNGHFGLRHSTGCPLSVRRATHADYTGLHYRYSGVMRALPAWPPKWRASSRQPGGVGQSHVVAIGGGGKETRDARIKSKRSSCLYFLCAR